MNSANLKKKREILFSKFPPGQVPEAADQLQRLGEIEVLAKYEQRTVEVGYDLTHHTLLELEEHLVDRGYHLDNTLMTKLMRALVHYVEDTQLHNLRAPERRAKRSSQEAYVAAWEHHPHGDHDDTPPEWREYK
ncbi:MAG TPA: hypothetical protein VFF03_19625 [Rhodocyclaceae bacterium]|nr:hypothetical protein [Rhodocyclaceae bacterium]